MSVRQKFKYVCFSMIFSFNYIENLLDIIVVLILRTIEVSYTNRIPLIEEDVSD